MLSAKSRRIETGAAEGDLYTVYMGGSAWAYSLDHASLARAFAAIATQAFVSECAKLSRPPTATEGWPMKKMFGVRQHERQRKRAHFILFAVCRVS